MKKNNIDLIKIKIFKIEYIRNSNYLRWLKDKSITKNLYRPELLCSFSEISIKKYVKKLNSSKNDFFFSIFLNQEMIGTIKVGHIDWHSKSGDIGIMIGEKKYWGKGYAEESIKKITKFCKRNLKLRKLTGGTASNNIAMKKVFLKNGFKIEGVRKKHLLILNRYYDHILFGKFI